MKPKAQGKNGQLRAVLEALLASEAAGDVTGLMYVVSKGDRQIDSGISGLFATDLVYATAAASDGFNCLLGHKACIESRVERVNELPLRLRKEYLHEDSHCTVSGCGMRR